MKPLKLLALLLALTMLLGLCACGEQTPETESSQLTMYIGLGNTNSVYYEQLHDAILAATGIDVQMVFSNTIDTTSAMLNKLEAYDLPADIVITAMATDTQTQESAFLDLAAYTNVPDLFTSTKLQEVSVDGAVYQLPFTSRLIGIEYNKTLLEEMGWELPNTFDDMVALKEQVEAAGYTFAISGGVATGHGFNYLFHTMGSQYLAYPEGTEWLKKFQSAQSSVGPFARQAEYFEKYVQAGLFGTFHDQDWNACQAYCQERALFYYNIINDAYSYDGFRYNADGTLYGAEYDEAGNVIAQPDPEGEAVLVDGTYTLYDADDPDHAGLDRYTIPGAVVLHDEYGSMPWITENGASNCFTTYDCMFLALDRKLAEAGQEEKLTQAVQVLTFMTSDTATDLFSQLYADGYVSVTGYDIDESRLYYAYAEQVQKGYLVPWYYNDFDMDSIVNVGQAVNDYIRGTEGVTLQTITDELEKRNQAHLAGTEDILATVDETMTYAESAQLQAIAGALSAQQVLDEAGIDQEITVSLMPYIEKPTDINKTVYVGVVQEKFYAGAVKESRIQSYVNKQSGSPVVIQMTKAEIEALAQNGYNAAADCGLEKVFAYAVVTKNNESLKDGELYAVAVAPQSLENAVYQDFLDRGMVTLNADGEALTGDTVTGLRLYFADHPEVSAGSLEWN